MKDEFIKAAKNLEEQMIRDRRHIHRYPEVGMEVPNTYAYVKKRLEQIGCETEECGKYGITTTIGQGGKTLLIRAELDGLPTKEETDIPFKSENENGHLCGHDIHIAMVLGVATILKDREEELKGTVKLMFQPGEEIGIGAKVMIEHGILENPKVDACLALHVMPDERNGYIGFKRGITCAYLDGFMIEVNGKGGHGSRPEETIDPLNVVVDMYSMIKGVVDRESSPFNPAVCTIGVLGGGSAANVIPQRAVLEGSLRCCDSKIRERIIDRIIICANAACQASGATHRLQLISTPGMYSDPKLCEEMKGFICDINGADRVTEVDLPMLGSEDLSYISEKVPSMLLWMGTGDVGAPTSHSADVYFEEDHLYMGTATLAYCAVKWLENAARN